MGPDTGLNFHGQAELLVIMCAVALVDWRSYADSITIVRTPEALRVCWETNTWPPPDMRVFAGLLPNMTWSLEFLRHQMSYLRPMIRRNTGRPELSRWLSSYHNGRGNLPMCS